MSIGCVRSPTETVEHTLNGQEHHCASRKLTVEAGAMELGETHAPEPPNPQPHRDGQGQRKPRRKDTPILNPPPIVPGVRRMKGEKHAIHLEDEEKEENN